MFDKVCLFVCLHPWCILDVASQSLTIVESVWVSNVGKDSNGPHCLFTCVSLIPGTFKIILLTSIPTLGCHMVSLVFTLAWHYIFCQVQCNAELVVWSGSRKIVLSDSCIPQGTFQFSSVQHGKEGSKEGSSRSPQGDESDEGQEGVEVSAIEILAMLPPGWHRLFQFLTACTLAHP